jgi:hypothetical protein
MSRRRGARWLLLVGALLSTLLFERLLRRLLGRLLGFLCTLHMRIVADGDAVCKPRLEVLESTKGLGLRSDAGSNPQEGDHGRPLLVLRSCSRERRYLLGMELSEREQAVLNAIPNGGGDARMIHVLDLKPQAKSKVLAGLEAKGLVERYPNGWGPEQPWWWTRLPDAPAGFAFAGEVNRGDIYDRYDSNGSVVYIELMGDLNEYGCARAILKAGANNSRQTWIPLHILNLHLYYSKRRRGTVTTWSAQFACPTHGECTEEMVTTKKTCTLCGDMLIRY